MGLRSFSVPSGLKIPKFKRSVASEAAPSPPPTPPTLPPAEPPRPPPYEFSERIKALFDETPKKSVVPGVESFPIKYREGDFTKFKRRVRRTAGTYMIRAGPRTRYDQPHVRIIPRVLSAIKRRTSKCAKIVASKAKVVSRKAKAIGTKLNIKKKPKLLYKEYVKKDRNVKHGMDYDGFVDFVDSAIDDLRASRERARQLQEEAAIQQERKLIARDIRLAEARGYFPAGYYPAVEGYDSTGANWPLPNQQQQQQQEQKATPARDSFDWDLEGDEIYRVF